MFSVHNHLHHHNHNGFKNNARKGTKVIEKSESKRVNNDSSEQGNGGKPWYMQSVHETYSILALSSPLTATTPRKAVDKSPGKLSLAPLVSDSFSNGTCANSPIRYAPLSTRSQLLLQEADIDKKIESLTKQIEDQQKEVMVVRKNILHMTGEMNLLKERQSVLYSDAFTVIRNKVLPFQLIFSI